MSEKKLTSYYITSREGAIRAEFAEHGRDVAATQLKGPKSLAPVSHLAAQRARREDQIDDAVICALFLGDDWCERRGATKGGDTVRSRLVDLADLGITPAQFRASIERIFAVMDVKPKHLYIEQLESAHAEVKLRNSIYEENRPLMIDLLERVVARSAYRC